MRQVYLVALAILTLAMLSSVAFAASQSVPTGPDTLTPGAPGRHTDPTIPYNNAYAGNVTALNISTQVVTRGWQGYFGNVTGTITLDDAANNTMYDWALANPEGEVYASTSSAVSWDNISCATFENLSYHENTTYKFNTWANNSLKEVEDVDGIDETFNQSFSGDFYAGAVRINAARSCKAAYLYVSSSYNSAGVFTEVLLQDNTTANGPLVFASILQRMGATGFNGATNDFQMIVAENGHNGDESVTAYYFYVEIQ